MVLNSLNFLLSEKLFISPSILTEILTRFCNLGCRFFPFSTLNISCHSLVACRVSAERSAIQRMGFPLYVTCCFSLAAFNFLSLCLIFLSLISMCPWVNPVWDSLCLLDLVDFFFFYVGEISNYNLFKIFLTLFLLLFFWEPCNLNIGAFDIVPEVSETILSSFHSFYFILIFRSYFYHFFFQLTDLFFCFRDSAIDSFWSIFNFSNCVVCLCMFTFNSCRSFLIDSCTFSILFSRFLIIFTIIIRNYFSGSLPISSSFIWTSVFLVCAFICAVFLCLFIFFLNLLCLRSPFPRLQG